MQRWEDFSFYDGIIIRRFVFDVSTASDRSNLTYTIKFSRSHFEGKIILVLRETKKQDCLYWHLCDTIRMRQEPCVYLRARLLVVPGACFAARPSCPIPGGNHFRPPRPPTALSPSRFRRIWIGPDNIAVGTTPRLHRHDIRGRISYIPLFPSFRIHL